MAQKIDKQTSHKLKQMAEKLPPLQASDTYGRPMFKRVRKGGAELLREFPNGTDEFERPFVAAQYYWRDMPMLVKHETKLRELYVAGGMDMVEDYCKNVQEIYEKGVKPRSRFGALYTYLKLKIMQPFLKWKHPLQEQAEILAASSSHK